MTSLQSPVNIIANIFFYKSWRKMYFVQGNFDRISDDTLRPHHG